MTASGSAELRYLPPHGPDLNPIENAFARVEAPLRKVSERTADGLWFAIGRLTELFKPDERRNDFAAAGCDAT